MTVRTAQYGPLSIAYDHRVLEPRPWTAAQSRWISALLERHRPARCSKLCSGAGHIGLLAVLDHASHADDGRPRPGGLLLRGAERRGGRDGRPRDRAVRGHARGVAARERYAAIVADPPWVTTAEVGAYPEDPDWPSTAARPGSTWSAPAST